MGNRTGKSEKRNESGVVAASDILKRTRTYIVPVDVLGKILIVSHLLMTNVMLRQINDKETLKFWF